MDTRLLRSFLAVVRTGSITAAAAELAYVQSTVTAHVQALERLTGTRLLDRVSAGALPTAAGAQLAERAGQILDLEDRMLAELAPAGQRPAGMVRLCAPESVCAYRLPPVLRALSEEFPEVRLSLAPATTDAALAAIRKRWADLALVLEPSIDRTGLEVTDLGRQALCLVAPANTPLPRRRAITDDELSEAGALLLEEGCGYSDELAARLATDAPRFGSVETVKRCVEAGLGLALLPSATVEDELADGRLVQLKPPSTSEHRLWLVRSSHRWPSPAVEAVRSTLEERARDGV